MGVLLKNSFIRNNVCVGCLSLLSGCLNLNADKPNYTNEPTRYLARPNETVTLSIDIPDKTQGEGKCTLSGSLEGVLGQWTIGNSEFKDSRIVRFLGGSQSYNLHCEHIDRGINDMGLTINEYPKLAQPALFECNVMCVNGSAYSINANCGVAPYPNSSCGGASCTGNFTGVTSERCYDSSIGGPVPPITQPSSGLTNKQQKQIDKYGN